MPRQITKTIYTYQELLAYQAAPNSTPQLRRAVERAKQWLSDDATDHNWWEYTYEMWEQALDQIGFENAKINFSGFCSQGDGASFTAKVDLEKMVAFFITPIEAKNCIEALAVDKNKPSGFEEDFRPWLVHKINGKRTNPKYWFLLWIQNHLTFESYRNTSHYSHSGTCTIEGEWPGSHLKHKLLMALLHSFREDLEDLRRWLSEAIYKDLEKEFEYLNSDEQLAEMASANGYTFDINGEREG